VLRLFGVLAALFGATGVLLGAFGAHALRSEMSARQLETWQTAVSYQMLHALALLAIFLLARSRKRAETLLTVAGSAFVAGIVMFSGSLYALCLGAGSLIGPVTPLGGVSLVVGWCALAAALWKSSSD
jgi:uncharacterized membrane protein YgdD (TMEM256/DUF423 family)